MKNTLIKILLIFIIACLLNCVLLRYSHKDIHEETYIFCKTNTCDTIGSDENAQLCNKLGISKFDRDNDGLVCE